MVLTLAIISTIGLVLSLVFAAVRGFGDWELFPLYFLSGLITTCFAVLVIGSVLMLWTIGLGIPF